MQRAISGSSFGSDTRGVAPVIGFILLFGILILGLTTYQAQIVPQENAATEFQHFEEVRDEMIETRNSVSTAGQADVSQFQDLKLGTRYQTRVFTVNPPPPSGTLQTSDAYNITITDETDTTTNVSTKFITYRPDYFEIDVGSLWYEHSVVYLDERETGGVAIIEDQNLLTEDGTVRLTALQGTISESKTGRETIELYPADSDAELSGLTGNLTIELPTRLNGSEYWNEALDEHPEIYDQVVDAGYETGVHTLRLENVSSDDGFELNTVGVNTEPTENPSRYNINVGGGGSGGGGSPSGSDSDLVGDDVAFDDQNGNNLFDDGETTYTADEVGDLDLSDVNLVIEKNVQTDVIDQTLLSLTVRDGIQVETTTGVIDFETDNNNAGSLDVSGSTLASATGKPLLLTINQGDGDIDLQGATVESGQVLRVELDSASAGSIDATDATLKSASSEAITFKINAGTGDITLQNANIDSAKEVLVNINDEAAGGIDARGSTISSASEKSITLKIAAGTGGIDVQNADIDSGYSLLMLINDPSAGSIDATGATLRSANGQPVKLEVQQGTGNIDLKDTRIVLPTSTDGVAIGNDNGNELFVNTDSGNGGTVVIDRADTDADLSVVDMDVDSGAELERGKLD